VGWASADGRRIDQSSQKSLAERLETQQRLNDGLRIQEGKKREKAVRVDGSEGDAVAGPTLLSSVRDRCTEARPNLLSSVRDCCTKA
jgi:hypothetical protein